MRLLYHHLTQTLGLIYEPKCNCSSLIQRLGECSWNEVTSLAFYDKNCINKYFQSHSGCFGRAGRSELPLNPFRHGED